jgi:2-oxoglutarate ferredoxin oxidoreductase subunit beta
VIVEKYLRPWAMPTILCPGCAHGLVLRSFFEAVERLGLDQDRTVLVAGIGCSARLVGYADFCTLHTTHGRAPGFATGVKLARPELNVVVITGDGDGLGIGGNHLIHAARRNVDVTVFLLNNAIYGMTGGQTAPTTPRRAVASTAPGGNLESPFDACALMIGAGAGLVARTLAAEQPVMTGIMVEALAHQGFSFVEVISDCPEYYGRYNGLGRGPEMLAWMKRREAQVSVAIDHKRFVPHLPTAPAASSLPTGILHREEKPVFTGRETQ